MLLRHLPCPEPDVYRCVFSCTLISAGIQQCLHLLTSKLTPSCGHHPDSLITSRSLHGSVGRNGAAACCQHISSTNIVPVLLWRDGWQEKAQVLQVSPVATGLIGIYLHLGCWGQFLVLPVGNKKDTRTRGSCNNLYRFSSFFLFCWQALQHDINLVTLGRNEIGCRLPGVVKKTILSCYSINNAAQAQYASCWRCSSWPGTKLLHLRVGCLKKSKCSDTQVLTPT